jgi:hypothetical protein
VRKVVGMGSFRDSQLVALETTEKVLASLAMLKERDQAIDALMAVIGRDRERILNSMFYGETFPG